MPVVGTVIHPRLIIDPQRSDFNLNVPLNGPLNIREDAMQPPASSFFLLPDNNLALTRVALSPRAGKTRVRGRKERKKKVPSTRILVDLRRVARLDPEGKNWKGTRRREESNTPPTHRIRTVN